MLLFVVKKTQIIGAKKVNQIVLESQPIHTPDLQKTASG